MTVRRKSSSSIVVSSPTYVIRKFTLGHLCKKTLFLKRIVKKLLRQKSPKLKPLGDFI